jgi:hypothetical protein
MTEPKSATGEPQMRLLCNYIEICLQFIPRINVVGFLADLKGDEMKCPNQKCLYTWEPNVEVPKRCPRCGKWLQERPAALKKK